MIQIKNSAGKVVLKVTLIQKMALQLIGDYHLKGNDSIDNLF